MASRSAFGLAMSLALVGVLAQVAAAAELNVPSPTYPTIQSAINAAATDDVSIVAPGTYYENINFGDPKVESYLECYIVDYWERFLSYMWRAFCDGQGGEADVEAASESGLTLPQLVSTEPPMDTTLCRVTNNCIRLTFDQPVALTGGNELLIRAIGLSMGPDFGGSFTCSIDLAFDPSGNTLKAKENLAVLTNKVWYRVESNLLDCQPFALDLCTLIGDVNNDGLVFTTDYGFVKRRIPPPMPPFDDCAREDLNGDGLIFPTDYGYIKAHIPSFKPPKPPG